MALGLRHALLALVFGGALLGVAGCYSPYIRVSPAFDDAPKRAWIQSFTITLDENAAITDRPLFAANAKRVGHALVKRFRTDEALLGGFETYFDEKKAKAMLVGNVVGSDATAFLAGAWYDERTCQIPMTPLNLKTSYQSTMDKFPDDWDDAVMTINLDVSSVPWNAFLPAMRTTMITVRVNVFTRDGTKIFTAGSRGKGGLSFFLADFSPDAMNQAFEQALANLKNVKVEPIGTLDNLVQMAPASDDAYRIAVDGQVPVRQSAAR